MSVTMALFVMARNWKQPKCLSTFGSSAPKVQVRFGKEQTVESCNSLVSLKGMALGLTTIDLKSDCIK